VLADASFLPLKVASFETVVAAEVIEHMNIERGLKMLDEMEKVAKKRYHSNNTSS